MRIHVPARRRRNRFTDLGAGAPLRRHVESGVVLVVEPDR